MARGRKRIWSAVTAPPAIVPIFTPDQWERDLLQYLQFGCHINVPPGPVCLMHYASSQLAAGLDPVAISNRVDALLYITEHNAVSTLLRHRVGRLTTALRKQKANAGGPKRKIFSPIEHLQTNASRRNMSEPNSLNIHRHMS